MVTKLDGDLVHTVGAMHINSHVESPDNRAARGPAAWLTRHLTLMRTSTYAAIFTAGLLQWVMPTDCPCGVTDVVICHDCAAELREPAWRRDGQATVLRRRDPPLRTFAGARYEGRVRRLILDYKDAGRLHFARNLGMPLTAAIEMLLGDPEIARRCATRTIYLVPVPVRWSARLRRGDDHVMNLLRPIGRGRTTWVVAEMLTVSDSRASQKSAGLGERATLTRRSIRIRSAIRGMGELLANSQPLAGMQCVIVDDVVTSGATLRDAAAALEGAGAIVLGAACVAATPRR